MLSLQRVTAWMRSTFGAGSISFHQHHIIVRLFCIQRTSIFIDPLRTSSREIPKTVGQLERGCTALFAKQTVNILSIQDLVVSRVDHGFLLNFWYSDDLGNARAVHISLHSCLRSMVGCRNTINAWLGKKVSVYPLPNDDCWAINALSWCWDCDGYSCGFLVNIASFLKQG